MKTINDRKWNALAEGETGCTEPRTITESDMVTFACITGDFSRLHMDREFSLEKKMPGRVVHGMLGASYVVGMISHQTPVLVGRSVSNVILSAFEFNHKHVVLLNDTIHCCWKISRVNKSTNSQVISIEVAIKILNQEGAIVGIGSFEAKKVDASFLLLNGDNNSEDVWPVSYLDPDPKVYYLDDYYPNGQEGSTEARTLTQTDIVNYCGLTADYNPIYVDKSFSDETVLEQALVPPLLVFNIYFASWLRQWMQIDMPNDSFAGHISDQIKVFGPVFVGDTLHARFQTLDVRQSKSKPNMGILTFGIQVVNQHSQVVQFAKVLMMYPAKPQE